MVSENKSRKVTLYGPRIDNEYAIDINDIPSSNLICFKASEHDKVGHGIKD